MSEDITIEQKKEKLKALLNNPYKIVLGMILALAIIIRFYFYNIAKDQAHWWDTLAYGGLAKNILYGVWNDSSFLAHESIIRPPLLPWLWSLLLKFGVSDAGTIIFLEIIPSILSVWLIYLIAKELYNEKVGLIASFIACFSWIFLFYSVRIMSDVPSLFFALASIYFFVKGYEEIKVKEFALSVFFLALAVMTRYSYSLIAVIYIIFLIVVHRQHLLKKKGFWIGGIIGAIPLIFFFIFNIMKYSSLLPAGSVYSQSASEKASFAFYVLNFLNPILQEILLIIFLLGLLLIIWEILIGFDNISKIKRIRSNLFGFLTIFAVFFFHIFIIRAAEDRYLMTAMPFVFIFIGLALLEIYNFIQNYSKNIAILLIVFILFFGAYSQISFGKALVDSKKESYSQMKEAFLWIKDNTAQNTIIGGDGIDPYVIFYSERIPAADRENESIQDYVKRIDYMVLHRFEHQTSELVEYVNANSAGDKALFTPVKAVFFDKTQTEPAILIYKLNKNNLIV